MKWVALNFDHLQQREEHWAIVDLVGKGGHGRAVPVPDWVRNELNDWLAAAAIDRGKLFRRASKAGTTWGERLAEKAVWHVVKEAARGVGVPKLAPHDLRRYAGRRNMPSRPPNALWSADFPVLQLGIVLEPLPGIPLRQDLSHASILFQT